MRFRLAAALLPLLTLAAADALPPAPAAPALVAAAPAAPAGVRADASRDGIVLAWKPSADHVRVVTYRAEWSPDGLHFGPVDSTTALSAKDTDAPANATLWYRVVAVDADGRESAPSPVVRVQTAAR